MSFCGAVYRIEEWLALIFFRNHDFRRYVPKYAFYICCYTGLSIAKTSDSYARRCVPHIYGPVKELLDQNFGNDWIGRGGPLVWPPYSPDLNTCDFYLLGHIEYIVCQVPLTSIEHLKNRIREITQSVNENTLMRVWDNKKKGIRSTSVREWRSYWTHIIAKNFCKFFLLN